MWQKRAFQILLFLCGASFLLVLFLLYDDHSEKNQVEQNARNQTKRETLVVVQQIDEVLEQLLSIANILANDLSAGKLPRSQIKNRLEQIMANTPYLFGIGVAYIPYVNEPQTRRQSPYYMNRTGTLEIEEHDILQLFVVPCSYRDPKTQYQIPKCVVFIEYSLKDIKTLMTTLELGKTGYGFILSKQGTFITHPIPEYVKERKSIFNIAIFKNDKTFEKLGERVLNGESGIIEYIDEITGQSTWIFHQPIVATGWVMCTLIRTDEFFNKTLFWQKQAEITLWVFVFLLFLSALLSRVYQGNIHQLWLLIFSISMLSLLGLGWIWYIEQTAPYREDANSTIIVDKPGLYQFLSANIKPKFLSKQTPIYVPTSIFIESVEFSDNNNTILTGSIWQTYDNNIHKNISRGFTLANAESIKIIGAEHHNKNQKEVIKWYFESIIAQQFDYSKYPLDKRKINLLIHHKDINQNVILIPDLDAYPKVNLRSIHPNIKPDLVLPGWHIKKSFFHYKIYGYDSYLEMDNQIEKRNFPNLYFTIVTQRDFLNPFIGKILPFIVVGVVGGMLFAVLLLLGKVKTFANVVTPLGALFLSILFAHLGLRQEISISGLFYIEYYYLVMYIATIVVISSYFLFHTKSNLFFIQYRNGLVQKLLFWPFILGSLLAMTIWTFYD